MELYSCWFQGDEDSVQKNTQQGQSAPRKYFAHLWYLSRCQSLFFDSLVRTQQSSYSFVLNFEAAILIFGIIEKIAAVNSDITALNSYIPAVRADAVAIVVNVAMLGVEISSVDLEIDAWISNFLLATVGFHV